jgi:hypothetical protein
MNAGECTFVMSKKKEKEKKKRERIEGKTLRYSLT